MATRHGLSASSPGRLESIGSELGVPPTFDGETLSYVVESHAAIIPKQRVDSTLQE